MSLFDTGIRPAIDTYLAKKAAEKRNYGNYWSASSAGCCMRLNILKRLDVPCVPEIAEDEARSTRVFEVGHIFHEWVQRITKEAGLSIAQELELQDENLMIRGHIDDLILIPGVVEGSKEGEIDGHKYYDEWGTAPHLILYDYKTANSQAFNYKRDEIGHYHKMQLGTYMYMLRNEQKIFDNVDPRTTPGLQALFQSVGGGFELSEARIMQISKDDLRLREQQLLWTPALKRQVEDYWTALNAYWRDKTLPPCTCLDHDGGFLGKRSKKGKIYNNYFYNDTPCSLEWAYQFDQVKEFLKEK